MNLFKSILWVIVGTLLIACSSIDDNTRIAQLHFKNYGIAFDPDLKYCIVLPEVGCEGCIAAGVSFFKDNKDAFLKEQSTNMVVFTAVNSKKMLHRTLGLTSLDRFNCILDLDNRYLIQGNNSIYPLILYLEKGEITKAAYQSPFSSDILGELERRISK